MQPKQRSDNHTVRLTEGSLCMTNRKGCERKRSWPKLNLSRNEFILFSSSPGATTPVGGCILQPSSALYPPRVRGYLITHNDAPQSVGLLWTNDQSVAKPSTWQHTTLTTDKYPCPRVGFEPTISAGERPKTYALDRAATGTGNEFINVSNIQNLCYKHTGHTEVSITKGKM